MNTVKRLREQKGLTVRELSEKSTVSIGYISDLENDESMNPSKDVMTKIALALDATVPEVFFPDQL